MTRALDAFVSLSSQSAGEILRLDDKIDELHRSIYQSYVEQMKKEPALIDKIMKLIYIAKYLERIADHATNFAEQVIFVVEGLDIRHEAGILPTPH